jgi:hypothetical protein
MKTTFKTILFLFVIGFSSTVNAQKKPYYNTQEQAVTAATQSLDEWLQTEEVTTWLAENQMQGTYTFNITIGGTKGEVKTVNILDRKEGSIPLQNKLKDLVKAYRFPFKMPKDKSYQFSYEFKF